MTTTDMKQWYLKQLVTDATLVATGGGAWIPLSEANMFGEERSVSAETRQSSAQERSW